MVNPHTALVLTARTGLTPSEISSGTVIDPPLMPTTAESAPIPVPAGSSQGERGTGSTRSRS